MLRMHKRRKVCMSKILIYKIVNKLNCTFFFHSF
uniref:Uncharacterized protein n=1 Tax=Anguilla anguilla TaxID=7936 RepID=A0A0E9PBP4_ANGAN